MAAITAETSTSVVDVPAGSDVVMPPLTANNRERDRLVTDHLGLVRRVCARFRYSGEPMEDLVQVGSLGLLKAAAKFDPELGSNFPAYAVPVIVGEIKNYFRDHGWAVKIPRKLQSQKLLVDRTVPALNQHLGRPPKVTEIAEAAGLTVDTIYRIFEVEAYSKPLSLDSQYDHSDSHDTPPILDFVGSKDPQLEALPNKLDLARTMGCLDLREKTIIYLYFYKNLCQTEIAERLSMSQMHVSRLQRRALSKLREEMSQGR